MLLPILPYLVLRLLAQSHWLSGDYSYNLIKLPYNVLGNIIGYLLLAVLGPISLPISQQLRNFSKGHIFLIVIASLVLLVLLVWLYKFIMKKLTKDEQRVVQFGFLFFVIALLPFLGLGNITSRYSYLASFGFVLLFTLFLKKVYEYFLYEGKYIAQGAVVIVLCIFCFTQLIQLQKIHGDWLGAGQKSQAFLISLEKTYTTEPVTFYFVNTPIRHGDAWVFPVGIPDALWFTFQKNYLGVNYVGSVAEAFAIAENATNARVFEFKNDGSVQWVTRTKSGKIVPRDF